MLTMLCMVVLGIVGANAQTTYTVSFDKTATQTPEGSNFFTITNGSYSSKGKHSGTYKGVTYGDGLKVTSSTDISFKTSATSVVTIVQTINNATSKANYVNFDGTNKTASDRVDDEANNVGVYTISNVAAGEHQIKRASGEIGLIFIQVDEEAVTTTQLATPSITFNASNGLVTIGSVENADGVYYTTDGTVPSVDNGKKYTEPFTVEDGTVVKAIAEGDATKYRASEIASVTVLLDNVTIDAPTFTTFNGTVGLSTETANATIEYSLDGSKYQAYTKPFTLTENGTVYARATRAGKTSEVASQEVTAIAKPEGTETVYISYWDKMSGNSATNADGYTLAITGNTTKNWSKGNIGVTINGTDYNTIKLSNGAQNTLTLPAGKVAKRITFYSNVNADNGVCGWKEVAGTSYENGDGDYKKIPMGSFKSTDPDVRVYALDDATSITFTNAGKQLQFVIALDVADASTATTETATITSAGYATYVTKNIVDLSSNTGVKAFTAKYDAASSTITLTPTTATVPAGTALVLKGAEGSYNFTVGATAEEVANNDLKATTEPLTADGSQWILAKLGDQVGFAPATPGTTIPAGKAYLVIKGSASSKGFIGISDGDATGINQISASQNTLNENAPMFNLAGQQVTKAYKGVILQNGKKFINK